MTQRSTFRALALGLPYRELPTHDSMEHVSFGIADAAKFVPSAGQVAILFRVVLALELPIKDLPTYDSAEHVLVWARRRRKNRLFSRTGASKEKDSLLLTTYWSEAILSSR